jgi:hypothetical protein
MFTLEPISKIGCCSINRKSPKQTDRWAHTVIGLCFALTCLFLLSPTTLSSQQGGPDTTPRKPIAISPPGEMEGVASEMAKLSFLIGDWKGSGWMELPTTGGRVTFPQTKNVHPRLQGRMIEIEGLSDTSNPGFYRDTLVFVAYDTEKKGYRIRGYAGPGKTADGYALLTDNVFEWGYTYGPVLVRYRISVDPKGQWDETGESSLDKGATWQLFSEILLEKSK